MFSPFANPKRVAAPEIPAEAQAASMPLAGASIGQELVLVAVEGGRRLRHRLAEMGLLPGVSFRVVNRAGSGPFIISLKHARLVLGHGMVLRLRVRALGQPGRPAGPT